MELRKSPTHVSAPPRPSVATAYTPAEQALQEAGGGDGAATKSGTAIIDTTSDFILSLPKSDSFYRTDFAVDNQEDLKKVEQGNR